MRNRKIKTANVNPRPVVKAFGGQNATGRALGVSQQAVFYWLKRWDEKREGIPAWTHLHIARAFPDKYGHLVALT